MENLFLINFYTFLLAASFAVLEIQIEGPHGWAANLPTWRSQKKIFGKAITGYHLTIFTLALLLFHFPYIFGFPFTINSELKTLSLFFMFVVLWDFLWFVLNPHYPLRHFNKEFIRWHKKWYIFAPVDYFLGLGLSFGILLPLILIESPGTFIQWWLSNILLFSLQTLLIIIFTIYILKIDNWHKNK